MKICLMTTRYPLPENAGDVVKTNNLARYLRHKGHTVILVSFCEEKPDIVDRSLYNKIYLVKRNKVVSALNCVKGLVCNEPLQTNYYYSKAYEEKLKNVIAKEKPDLYIAQLLRMVPYLYDLNLVDKSIIEMSDALSKTYALSQTNNEKFSVKRLIYKIEKDRIKKYELQVIHDFKKIVLCSEKDKEYFGNPSNVYVYPNGVNIPALDPQKPDKNKIVFVGNMRTLQNQDAVFYFVREIFPKIKKQNPNIKFYVVGAQPSKEIQELDNCKDIIVTGFVEKMEEFISDAYFAVAPIRIAAGMQNKVLVAMACHVPVILSSTIAKSIPGLKSETNCYIAENDNDYVRYASELMADEEKRKLVTENGFEFVKNEYDWFKRLEGYENF